MFPCGQFASCNFLIFALLQFAILQLSFRNLQFANICHLQFANLLFATCLFAICLMFYILLARIGAPPWGAFRPNVWNPNPAQPSWFSHRNLDDFDVDLGSFWDRSWVPLGGHFRSSWRLFRSKLGQKPSSNRLIFEKVVFQSILCFSILWVFFASTWHPKTTQDRSKTGPRSSWIDVFPLR